VSKNIAYVQLFTVLFVDLMRIGFPHYVTGKVDVRISHIRIRLTNCLRVAHY